MSNNNKKRCGACKSMRRGCVKDCIYAPYFPPNDLQRFMFVHHIFGATKFAHFLQQIPEERREEAVESMVMEARYRVRNPVYGSVGILTQLHEQIIQAEFELAKTRGLIAFYKHQYYKSTQETLVNNDASFLDSLEADPLLSSSNMS